MKLIGLSGGIASGKSTIGRRLEELGAIRIDADRLARDAVLPGTPALAGIAQRFGSDVIASDGTLDRPALGRLVFGDGTELAALNEIVHPAVRELARRGIEAARSADPDAVVVYEIPLLVETRATGVDGLAWDLVVIADAPAELRERRLIELRGMDPDEARQRVRSQADDSDRRAIADVLIDTSGSEASTLEQVDVLWARLKA